MTIGIGVLCSTKPKPHAPRPDAIVMVSDTMGSTDTDSTDDLHKMFIDEERMLFAVGADRMEKCADLWPCIQKEITSLEKKSHGDLLDAINKAVLGHRRQHFKYDVLYSKYALNEQFLLAQPDKIQEEWANYDPGAALIVGMFDDIGQALLYLIQHPGQYGSSWVEPESFPGHAVIGSGGYNASFWLNYRRQHLGLSLRQSAYHAYEASKMASKAPTVNDDIEIMVATKREVFHTSSKHPPKPGSPITLEQLSNLFLEYGPRSTGVLEFPKQSTQTSAGQQ
jgi:hypothetical protein